ncbi:hypothetical protein Mp_3g05660 [Marchantia polymorpha subsp. ruderalis]|uniref:Uncharacterized protein n=2 Tax=Marchantia polymorpha TaxID=3197 RepID=A0AAF6AXS1_MARPO|nr:hypothetical protein MARPO_0006s0038 [Marchantia polymorpha]BBN04555.1 hypothetical protein Mp_3g05660 [Marchantia polymorpha subsp. ruderalis]|eukprot:PTQ47993.1 hypothetical protein MARPO_0006s0038 [Marchantia polymorpha]
MRSLWNPKMQYLSTCDMYKHSESNVNLKCHGRQLSGLGIRRVLNLNHLHVFFAGIRGVLNHYALKRQNSPTLKSRAFRNHFFKFSL